MRLETFIVISKGLAYMLVGTFTPWTGALAQWVNSNTWPEKIVWVGVILPMSIVGAATGWLGFTSGSWKEYVASRNSNGALKPATPPQPETPNT